MDNPEGKFPAVVKSVSKGTAEDKIALTDVRIVLDVPARFAAKLLTRVNTGVDIEWKDQVSG